MTDTEALPAQLAARHPVTFLPDPEPVERRFTVVSVDDHLVEPPDVFQDRVPANLREAAPRIVEVENGSQQWLFDGQLYPNVGLNAVVGRPRNEYLHEPARFDEMRRGAWDPVARLAEMDLDGVWASMCFPSLISGFAGRRLTLGPRDPALAFASFRAYNDWHLEEWVATDPERLVPLQIPWLRDPEVAADEIRRNAARGFRAVSFPDIPHELGLPSLHTGYWDPFFAACQDTDTAVCLHFGSADSTLRAAPDAHIHTAVVLTGFSAVVPAVDWLYSRVPVRFPGLKIILSEGGISWVAGLLDRLDHVDRHAEIVDLWSASGLTPAEVVQRNFWFCFLDDVTAFATRHRIGIENILCEVDYPHADSSWPNTQNMLADELRPLPDDEIEQVTWRNAANLLGLEVPAAVVATALRARQAAWGRTPV